MEESTEAKSLFDEIKPPRSEDAGLEDCALPPESIEEAFLKAASAVGSGIIASDDEDESGDDPSEYSSVAITEKITAPSDGCAVTKDGGSMVVPSEEVSDGGGDGVEGLEIGGKSRGILGKKAGDVNDDVAEDV